MVFTAEEDDILYRGTFCPRAELQYNSSHNSSITLLDAVRHLYSTKVTQTSGNDSNNGAKNAEEILNSVVMSTICVLGIIGNLVNLVILSHRSWQVSLGRMERFVQSGLIALAVSDLCFCLSLLPMAVVDQHQPMYVKYGFKIFYLTYCNGFTNTFALCSTMLTVTIAVGRYFATVHPIRAREKFGMTFAKRILLTVCVTCTILNIPRYWFKQVRTIHCLSDNSKFYYIHVHSFSHSYKMAYLCIYFILAIWTPFIVLAYCNIYLVKALKQSVSSPIVRRRTEIKHEAGSYRITLTLVIIVVAFFIFVVPTETLFFWRNLIVESSGESVNQYNLLLAVFSNILVVNFSFNFVLYCVVNSHFRRTIHNILTCNFSHLAKRKCSMRYESGTITSGANGNNAYNNYQVTLHLVSKSSPRRTSVTEL